MESSAANWPCTPIRGGAAAEAWPLDAVLRVRMGVHAGEAVECDGDYFGRAVNQAARLMAQGHGDQVLCSATTAAVVEDLGDTRDLGEHRLRDVAAPVRAFHICRRGRPGNCSCVRRSGPRRDEGDRRYRALADHG